MKVLLTTTDYPPKLGGLSTFTLNIEKVLQKLGVTYDVFVYRKDSPKSYNEEDYDYFLNIHFLSGSKFTGHPNKHINFYHGSEILFYSPHPLKHCLKKFTKHQYIRYFESTLFNLFISQFTFDVMREQGLHVNYSRDFVIHNSIDISGHEFIPKDMNAQEIEFVCICRDVPHKNIDGAYDFLRELSTQIDKKIKFYITSPRLFPSTEHLTVMNIDSCTDDERTNYLKRAHFNLLFSKDHRHLGFYEGFGLTVLEAGMFGVPSVVLPSGGLPEAVHHNETGWVLTQEHLLSPKTWWEAVTGEAYENICKRCYDHTLGSHNLDVYEKLLGKVLK